MKIVCIMFNICRKQNLIMIHYTVHTFYLIYHSNIIIISTDEVLIIPAYCDVSIVTWNYFFDITGIITLTFVSLKSNISVLVPKYLTMVEAFKNVWFHTEILLRKIYLYIYYWIGRILDSSTS